MLLQTTKIEKKVVWLGILMLTSLQSRQVIGESIEVSVTTDKTTYLLGEEIGISVTAFNPNDYELSLDALSYYKIDDGKWLPLYIMIVWPPIPLPPMSSYTWDFEHFHGPPLDPDYYPLLEIGEHSVVGQAAVYTESYIQSEPFQFSVIPEPATVILMSLGALGFVRRRQPE